MTSTAATCIQKTCRYGTSGCGLEGMLVMGWRLD